MEQNIGQIDKKIRAGVGVAIIVAGFATQSWWGAVGIVPLLTSLAGFCPLYTLLGFSTCEKSCRADKPGKGGSSKS